MAKSELRTIWQAEVLEVDISSRVKFSRRLHESVDEIIVLLASGSRLTKAKVEIIVEKFLVIGSTVEDDGEGSVRMYSSAECGKDELGDGDENASHALVADSKDLFTV